MKPCKETMLLQFMLEGPRPCTIHCLNVPPQLNILTKTFLLVSCSNTFQILLLFVQGQGQKGKQNNTYNKAVCQVS